MHFFRLTNETTLVNFCLPDENVYVDELRLLMLGFVGPLVSIMSLSENLLLFYVFSTSRKLRRQNYVNPVLLALFDSFVSVIYLLIGPLHFLAYRFKWTMFTNIFGTGNAMLSLYYLQHFALTVCNFLLVVASIERYLANCSLQTKRCFLVFMVRNRPYVIVCILAFAFLLKASLFFEIDMIQVPAECANMIQNQIPIWISDNAMIYPAFRFWTRTVLTVILPFLILAYCNIKIVQHLRKRHRLTLIGECSGSLMSQTNQNIVEHQLKTNGNRSNFTNIYQKLNYSLNDMPCQRHPTVNVSANQSSTSTAATVRHGIERHCNGSLMEEKHGERITLIRGDANEELHMQNKRNNHYPIQECGQNKNQSHRRISTKKHPGDQSKISSATAAAGPMPIANPNSNFGVRVATRTLVMVVGCYLISNSMSTIMNLWEYFDIKLLHQHQNYHAYLVASDIAALLTICGCGLRLPIYIINDKRIRKAICRAIIRFRFGCIKAKPTAIVREEEAEQFLEKYSIVFVSNSLRSNLTAAGQLDMATFKGRRSFDQLAILVQNRRKFLVQMTISLGAVQESENRDNVTVNDD